MAKWFVQQNVDYPIFIFQKHRKSLRLRLFSTRNLLDLYELYPRRKLKMNSLDNSTTIIDQTSSYMNASNATSKYECEDPYPNQKEILSSVSWWLDGFIQIIIGCMGFAGNTIAIPVLSSRKLSSIFNRILVFLAGIDSQRLFYQ